MQAPLLADPPWGIIGLGWLGGRMSTFLSQSNISWWGTTTQDFKWEQDRFPDQECGVLLLNTPPLQNLPPADFVAKIPKKDFQKILFVSSISVYGQVEGLITEQTSVAPQTPAALWLTEVEKKLQEKFREQICILRAGGLIGEDRHPVKSLSQSQRPVAGKALVNLIHREDLIRIIYAASQKANPPRILNAVCPYHPTKMDYYSEAAKKWNLPLPVFEMNTTENKVVGSIYLADLYPRWRHPKLDVGSD